MTIFQNKDANIHYFKIKILVLILKDWNKVILTQNPNFSIKWEMPLGYATSYLLPESIKTEKKNVFKQYMYLKSIKSTKLQVKSVKCTILTVMSEYKRIS